MTPFPSAARRPAVVLSGLLWALHVSACRPPVETPKGDRAPGEGGATRPRAAEGQDRQDERDRRDGDAVLARVGAVTLTERDLARQAARAHRVGVAPTTPAARQTLLDNLVRFELLAQEAERRGFMQDPEIVHVARQQAVAKLIQEEVGRAADPAQITDADVQQFYEKNRDTSFTRPAAARVFDLSVRDASEARRLLALARRLSPRDEQGFVDLVVEHGADPLLGRTKGDRGFVDANSPLSPPLVNAALAMSSPGELTGPVATEDGFFHVLRLQARRSAVVQSLHEAEPSIRKQIERARRDSAIEALVERLGATKAVHLPVAATRDSR